MPTLADSLSSSTARALAVKRRPDLVVKQSRYQGSLYWIVKDPLGLAYFRFQEEEFAILNMLDGRTSLDEMKRRFEKQFAPQKITLDELGRLIGMLHRSHLVIADLPGQGPQLLKRHKDRQWRELWGKFANILAIRFKGIDPERILTALLPWFGWLFTWYGAVIVLGTAISALLLVLVQFDQFQSKLPTFHEFFAARNWFWLGLALAVTKIFHEFGHGLSCKKFGGECHEMGAMLLVFTPCLYCNVSDSWMLPSKWQRAMIGAAGMYVELFIAGLATFGWWFSQPGLFNFLCLSTMFVSSVSTVMFNANPLMRYDGYYILSDLAEIPNLRQKATTILGRKLGVWCLGLKEQDDPFLPQRNQWFFALYSVAATVYLWIVSISILFFLYHVFEGNGLRVLGQLLALASFASLLVMPMWNLYKFFSAPGRMEQVKAKNVTITGFILAGVIGAIVLIPLPYRVFSSVEVHPSRAHPVYVEVSGEIVEVFVNEGDRVTPGTKLAQLKNEKLELDINELEQKTEDLRKRFQSLLRERHDPRSSAGNEIATIRKQLEVAEQQLELKLQDLDRLILVADVAGTIISPPALPEPPVDEDGKLPGWSGTPLQAKNRGAVLEMATLFCLIGNPQELEAIMVIDQTEVDFVRPGQAVEIKLDSLPHEMLSSTLESISSSRVTAISRANSVKTGGEIETQTDQKGIERPISTSYEAKARFDDSRSLLLPGMRGRARIHADPQTLGQRALRLVLQTLNFKL
ncbi:MAG: biotin/lipoyl-binding protein [Pirellulales bacterium]|nr:biotin/lipoyl-binding protein [Pirellulales bacterium]